MRAAGSLRPGRGPWRRLRRRDSGRHHQWPAHPPAHRQRGAALLLGLLLLSLLALLAGHAWSDNQWHLRAASQETSRLRAEAAARSALSWAERWLLTRPGTVAPPACDGACRGAPVRAPGRVPDRPQRLGETWWLDQAFADGFDPDAGVLVASRGLTDTPLGRWIIEEAHVRAEGGGRTTTYYRVVARAARAPRGAAVVIESILARPWGDPAWSDAPGAGPEVPARSFCRDSATPSHCGRLSWRRLE